MALSEGADPGSIPGRGTWTADEHPRGVTEARDATNVEDGVRFLTGIVGVSGEWRVVSREGRDEQRPVKLKRQSTAPVMRRLWVRAPPPALVDSGVAQLVRASA